VFGGSREIEARVTVPAMGTLANITVVCDEGSSEAILQSMDSLLAALEAELSADGPGTAGILNRTGRAALTPDFEAVLDLSGRMAAETRGAFDPSIAPVVDLWGFHSTSPSVPDSAGIDSALALCGWGSLSVTGDSVFLEPGHSLDLGAIVPGFAADRAYRLAIDRGASRALVEIGGEIRCGGSGTWRIAVTHPRADGFWCVLEVGECGMSTSGDYENYIESGGVRYCHIIDPATGWPESGVVSVTVVSPTSGTADALSTALAVRGPSLLDSIPDSLWQGALFILQSDTGLVERRFGTI
jgi:thiamine biosynthesis lipoprotein